MRILLITEFYPDKSQIFSGGVETRTYFTARHLAAKHQIIVICRKKDNETSRENSGNISILRLGKGTKSVEAKLSTIFSRFLFIFQSFFVAIKTEADIVEGSNFICLLPAFFIGVLKKIPTIAWYPDIYGKEWIKNFGFITGMFGLILEKLGLFLPWTKIIALSSQTKQKLISQGINPRKITVIYGGVDLDFIDYIKAKKYINPTICCVSRLVPYKDVDILLQAVALVKKQIPDINCLVIGKGPERLKLNQLVQNLEIQKNVKFVKNINYQELITKLKSSHVFCLPSRIEGFGLATIEAMASKLPYVIADIPINIEITDQKGGYFYKVGDYADLAEKIVELINDPLGSNKLVLAGVRKIQDYSWDHIAKQTETVYLALV